MLVFFPNYILKLLTNIESYKYKVKYTIKKLLLLVLFILSILMYILAPVVFNQQFCNWCTILYGLAVLVFFTIKNKKNYFDFDSIFFITYFFVMFFYPVFMFANNATHFFVFAYEFNEDVISRATALSLMGALSYMVGNILLFIPKSKYVNIDQDVKIPISLMVVITIIMFLTYIATGGYAYMINLYKEGAEASMGLSGYIFKFVPPLVISLLIINIYNLSQEKLGIMSFLKQSDKTSLLTSGVILFLILFTGSRTVPLQIFLVLGCLFTLFYKPISFLKFILLMGVGIVMMFGIVLMRGYTVDGNLSIVEAVMDLVINNRNSFVAMDYVDKYGLTMGRSMLSPLLAPIPMAQSVIFTLLNISPTDASSSMVITKLSLNSDELSFGFGTNIIADIYMSFGSIGVIMCMSLLGFIVAKSQYLSRTSIYYLAIYAVLCSYAVFLVRAEFLTFICYTLWVLAFVNIAKLHRVYFVFRTKRLFQ